jgi:sporulation protein YlmC with PRC-barrel domain
MSSLTRALNLVRLIGVVTVVASAPVVLAIAVNAQSPQPAPAEQSPPAVRPDNAPLAPKGPPAVEQRPGLPSTMGQRPAGEQGRAPAAPRGDVAARPGANDPLVGLPVFGSDGQKVGEVREVKAESDGRIREILVKTGGFLGIGGRIVAIPAGKFARSGQNVQLGMTSDDVGKLPRVEEKRS